MIKPSFLKPGDKVGLVAPGRKVKPVQVEAAIHIFETWALRVALAENIFSDDHSYLAGTDEQRISDFQMMLKDDSIKAIICARGGYGSTRILDQLDFNSFVKNPKWIVGFSDITAFHLKLSNMNVASIHGTMPILFSRMESGDSIESLRKILFGEHLNYIVETHPSNRIGNATGQLIGGNLSLIMDSIGTNNEPDTDGKILIIEEIDEYLYKVDRMMVQLKRAGKLDKLKGLIVGHMTDIKDTELSFGERIEEIIYHHASSFRFPIAFNFPTGHENPNLAWMQGAIAELDVTKDGVNFSYK